MGHKDSPRIPDTAGGRLSVQALLTRRHGQVPNIGGGINGVATFRDPALQGVDVALVERGDNCQGAGGASSCNGREIFFEHTDGRIVLIYPMGDLVLVGTTDTEADMTEDAVCTDAEIGCFLDLIGHVFPDIPVGREQIVYSFAGVRPLPKHDGTRPGFASRDYRIERREVPAGTVPATGELSVGELLIEVAEILPGPLGWDQAARAAEISDAQEVLKRFHRVRVHSLVT